MVKRQLFCDELQYQQFQNYVMGFVFVRGVRSQLVRDWVRSRPCLFEPSD